MTQNFVKLTGSPGNWGADKADEGSIKKFADASYSARYLQQLPADVRHVQHGLVPKRTVGINHQTHTKTGQTEALVSNEWVVTEQSQLKPDTALIALRVGELEAHRDGVIAGPVGFTKDAVEYPMSMSLTSQFRTAEAAQLGQPRGWVFSDGSPVAVTAQDLIAMRDAMAAHIDAAFVNFVSHKISIEVQTGQAILDYDITTGWPAVYEAP